MWREVVSVRMGVRVMCVCVWVCSECVGKCKVVIKCVCEGGGESVRM